MVAAIHALQSVPCIENEEVLSVETPRTRRLRSTKRAGGRGFAAALLDSAMTARGWSNEMAARCLGVDESFVRKIRSGESAFEVGDLLLLGSLGEDVLCELSAKLRDGRRLALERASAANRLTAAAGKVIVAVAEASADGVIEDGELDGIRRAFCEQTDAARGLLDVVEHARGGR